MNPGRYGSESIHLEREKTSTLHVWVQVGSVTQNSGGRLVATEWRRFGGGHFAAGNEGLDDTMGRSIGLPFPILTGWDIRGRRRVGTKAAFDVRCWND